MVKFIRRKLRNWLIDDSPEKAGQLVARQDCEPISDSEPILNFRVFSAVGGKVVEFRHYDSQRDRSHTQTYIITNEQDFGERIAKIATMEILKN